MFFHALLSPCVITCRCQLERGVFCLLKCFGQQGPNKLWFAVINRLALGLNDHWKRTSCKIRAFTVSHMDCFTLECSKTALLEQFGPGSEASETSVDMQDSAITFNSVVEFHYGHQNRLRNQWSWSQLGLIYIHYLLIIYSISHQFRFLIWALITAVIAVCSVNWWFHCSLHLFMCGCQEGFCCFSYVSISKNSSPNHQNGIQKSSKSPKWYFELGSGFRKTSEDCLQKENKFFRDFCCPADWLLEAFQVAGNLSQEASARLWHL